jgi:hypothetical protein
MHVKSANQPLLPMACCSLANWSSKSALLSSAAEGLDLERQGSDNKALNGTCRCDGGPGIRIHQADRWANLPVPTTSKG